MKTQKHALKLMMRTMGARGAQRNESKWGTEIDVLISQLSLKSKTPNTRPSLHALQWRFLFSKSMKLLGLSTCYYIIISFNSFSMRLLSSHLSQEATTTHFFLNLNHLGFLKLIHRSSLPKLRALFNTLTIGVTISPPIYLLRWMDQG